MTTAEIHARIKRLRMESQEEAVEFKWDHVDYWQLHATLEAAYQAALLNEKLDRILSGEESILVTVTDE